MRMETADGVPETESVAGVGSPRPCLILRSHRTGRRLLECALAGLVLLGGVVWAPAAAQEPMPQPPDELPVPQGPPPSEPPQPSGPFQQDLEPAPVGVPIPRPPRALPVGAEAEPERPKSARPIDQLLLQQGAVLLPAGWLQVEPFLDYSRFSRDRVAISGVSLFEAIVIGTIRADKVSSEIATAGVNLRYGLMNRLQLELRVPYVYRRDRELLAVGTPNEAERNVNNYNLGDIEGSLVWQAYLGSDSAPAVLFRLRGRSRSGTDPFTIPVRQVPTGDGRVTSELTEVPTGFGFWSFAPGVTLMWRSDPLVLFGGANYAFNRTRTIAGVGRLQPGDNWEVFMGMNFAVSEKLGLFMSVFDSDFATTRVNGVKRPNTAFNNGVLSIGTSIVLSPTRTMVVSIGKGLTKESPDFQFTISMPMAFNPF